MGIREAIRRWRHRRGYGVHSPLAFKLMKHVVRPDRNVAYYGEELLPGLYPQASRSSERDARRLLRFVAEMQPTYVWTTGKLPAIYEEAVRLAGCVVRIYDAKTYPREIDRADLIIVYDSTLRANVLKEALREGKSLIGFHMKTPAIRKVTEGMPGGVLIEWKDGLMAIPKNDSPLHAYTI